MPFLPRRAQLAIPVVLGLVLFVAGALKAQQWVTSPTGSRVFNSRLLALLVLEVEMAFAAWLWIGLYPKASRRVAFVLFSTFFLVSVSQAIAGVRNCQCFGGARVNPWYAALLDLSCLVLLFQWQPTEEGFP